MKNYRLLLIAGLLFGILFTSCEKDDDNNTIISDDEAAEIITNSLSTSSYGFITQVEDAAKLVDSIYIVYTVDSTFTIISPPDSWITYEYAVSYSYGIQMNGIEPEFFLNFTTNGEYTAQRITSSNQSQGELIVSNLTAGYNNYLLNGSCSRTGSQTVTIEIKREFSSTINFNMADISIDKTTLEILGGSAEVSIIGTSNSASYDMQGSIVFHGDKAATLTINGVVYEIDLENAEIS
ncbi:MAG: hypothetical protein K8R31_14920 [Bacteroidales bacterium]|nr:hypothetical protein [Bacteroidales bacterium]